MRRPLVLLAAGLVVVAGTARVAHAADEIAVSTDGVRWSEQLTEPLFDPTLLWVPGDSRTATLWLRNQTTDPSILLIDAVIVDTGGLAATDTITFVAAITGDSGDGAMTHVDGGGAHRLVSASKLAPGATVRIAVTVGLDADASNRAQALALEFHLRATLAQDTGALPPPPAVPPEPRPSTPATRTTGAIPGTGAWLTPQIVLAASFSLTLGTLVIAASRQRSRRG